MAKQRSLNRASSIAAPNSVNNLMQNITEEFLICKICLDNYRNPKSLNCLHTFCEHCIEDHIQSEVSYKKYSDYRDFTCPLCRKRTQLPLGGVKKLPDNFLVSSLSEMVGRQKSSQEMNPLCEICSLENEATSKCIECGKILCRSCVDMHKKLKVTQSHALIDLTTQKDVMCKTHEQEVVRYFCEPCQTCICVLCTFNEHREHDVKNFGEVVEEYKKNITKLLNTCKQRIDNYEQKMELINITHEIIAEAEDGVRNMAQKFVKEIESRQELMIEEIHNIYGKPTLDLLSKKAEFKNQLEMLKNASHLTEVALTRRDIELLLVKKDLESNMADVFKKTYSDINIPDGFKKVVRYLPGHIEMGCIQDMDRPLATTRFSCLKKLGLESDDLPTFTSQETQTDEVGVVYTFVQTDPPNVFNRASSPLLIQDESVFNVTASSTISLPNSPAGEGSSCKPGIALLSHADYNLYHNTSDATGTDDDSIPNRSPNLVGNIDGTPSRTRQRRRIRVQGRSHTVDSPNNQDQPPLMQANYPQNASLPVVAASLGPKIANTPGNYYANQQAAYYSGPTPYYNTNPYYNMNQNSYDYQNRQYYGN